MTNVAASSLRLQVTSLAGDNLAVGNVVTRNKRIAVALPEGELILDVRSMGRDKTMFHMETIDAPKGVAMLDHDDIPADARRLRSFNRLPAAVREAIILAFALDPTTPTAQLVPELARSGYQPGAEQRLTAASGRVGGGQLHQVQLTTPDAASDGSATTQAPKPRRRGPAV